MRGNLIERIDPAPIAPDALLKVIDHGHLADEARVMLKSVAAAGSGFTNNVVDSIVIFHAENGA